MLFDSFREEIISMDKPMPTDSLSAVIDHEERNLKTNLYMNV